MYAARRSILLSAFGLTVWLATPAAAAPFAVDGSLADWGLVVADGVSKVRNPGSPGPNYPTNVIGIVEAPGPVAPTYTFDGVGTGTNYTGLALGSGIWTWVIEDSNDTKNDYFLGPNHGGQDYDVEFLGLARQSDTIFAAIMSGIRPDNGAANYGPGDVFITVTDGKSGTVTKYVMEVGGGAGGGAGTALTKGADGTFYTLNGSGFTTASTQTPGVKTGTIWLVDDVNIQNDPITPKDPAQIHSKKAGKTKFADATDYLFTRNSSTSTHSIIEFSLDMTDFFMDVNNPDNLISITFSPSCGNDTLTATGSPPRVPEPTALSLLAAGLGLVGWRSRRRRA